MTADIFFPTLSRSSSASPSRLAAPASGQGEKIAGCAHTHVQFEDFDVAGQFISKHDSGQHVGFNFADAVIEGKQRCFDGFAEVVGNGGITRSSKEKHVRKSGSGGSERARIGFHHCKRQRQLSSQRKRQP